MNALAVALSALLWSSSPPVAAPHAGDAELLTGVVAAAASRDPRAEVLTAADVRTATDFEATRQTLGCSESSCLIEIANALDARVVVSGVLGQLGADWVLQLTLLDVQAGRPLARVSLRAADAETLASAAEAAVARAFATPSLSDSAVRVVVLDFTLTSSSSSSSSSPPPESPPPVLLISGAVGVGVGAVVAGVGVALDATSVAAKADVDDDLSLSAKDARAAYATSDGLAQGAAVAYAAAAVCVVVGGAVVVAGVLGE
jgi:hypothetical protein